MKFIQDLQLIEKTEDLNKLPEDAIKSLKKLVRDGAADLDAKWDNALALVKKAYETEGIEMPSPTMKTAWSQYEEMLSLGVSELADARKGFDSSWRMSSTVFREFKESMQKRIKIRVCELSNDSQKGHTVEVTNMQEVVDMVRKQAGGAGFDMNVEEHDDSSCTCKFSFQGIQRPYKVTLQRI